MEYLSAFDATCSSAHVTLRDRAAYLPRIVRCLQQARHHAELPVREPGPAASRSMNSALALRVMHDITLGTRHTRIRRVTSFFRLPQRPGRPSAAVHVGRQGTQVLPHRRSPPTRGCGPGDVQTYREHIWRREGHEALFGGAPPGGRCGQSTPFYLYHRQAQRRIRRLIPGAKLIVIFRDPVGRARSNWTQLWSAGLELADRVSGDVPTHIGSGPMIRDGSANGSAFRSMLLRAASARSPMRRLTCANWYLRRS
jgi:hypothetical protein